MLGHAGIVGEQLHEGLGALPAAFVQLGAGVRFFGVPEKNDLRRRGGRLTAAAERREPAAATMSAGQSFMVSLNRAFASAQVRSGISPGTKAPSRPAGGSGTGSPHFASVE